MIYASSILVNNMIKVKTGNSGNKLACVTQKGNLFQSNDTVLRKSSHFSKKGGKWNKDEISNLY